MATCKCGAATQLGYRQCLRCRKFTLDERRSQAAERQQRRRDRVKAEGRRQREKAIREEAADRYPEYVKFVTSRGIEPVSASEYANRMIHEREYPNDQA